MKSFFSIEDKCDNFFKWFCSLPEGFDCLLGLTGELPGNFPRFIETDNGGVGGFLKFLVGTNRFAEAPAFSDDVEDIVGNLKQQPERRAVAG